MKNIIKTGLFTFLLSMTTIASALFVQLRSNKLVSSRCSYLDPLIVDIMAFSAALFLIVEGMYKIVQNKDAPLKKQIGRSIRIAFGCGIVTLHVLQAVHK